MKDKVKAEISKVLEREFVLEKPKDKNLAHYATPLFSLAKELKKSPAQILKQAGDNVVAILNHNVPSAYLVPSSVYEKMAEIIEEYHLSKAVDAALASGEKPVKVSLDEL